MTDRKERQKETNSKFRENRDKIKWDSDKPDPQKIVNINKVRDSLAHKTYIK